MRVSEADLSSEFYANKLQTKKPALEVSGMAKFPKPTVGQEKQLTLPELGCAVVKRNTNGAKHDFWKVKIFYRPV